MWRGGSYRVRTLVGTLFYLLSGISRTARAVHKIWVDGQSRPRIMEVKFLSAIIRGISHLQPGEEARSDLYHQVVINPARICACKMRHRKRTEHILSQ